MTTLFTINQSWYNSTWLYEQLCLAQSGDAILLIEDAVLALQSPITLASFVAKCEAEEIAVYALQDDCTLRGVSNQHSAVQQIDYVAWVELVAQHQKMVAW